MKIERLALAALLAALSFAAGPAHAGFPGTGTLGEIQRSSFRYVCSNQPQTQCSVDPFTGQFDVVASCGFAFPIPSCVLDFVPNAEIRGLLTVIADDATPAAPPIGGGDVRVTVLLELQLGDERYALADSIAANVKIGEWFYVPEEADVFHFQFGGGALLNGRLSPLRQKLEEIGRAKLGVPASGVQAVMLEGLFESTTPFGLPKPRELETDASLVPGPGVAGNELASIARYRVTIKFVKLN